MTDEKDYQDRVRKSLLENKGKSEDTHERNLTYITAGTLGVSITFINTIVPLKTAHCKALLIITWILLVASLLFNLISHKITADFVLKKLLEFDKAGADKDKRDKIGRDISNFNRKMKPWNWFNIFLLISGITVLVIFCGLNIFK